MSLNVLQVISDWKVNPGWTLFLDRDGVINERVQGGYVRSPQGFQFLPGVLEGLAALSGLFGKIIVVTNQQGVGKGLMTETDLAAIHNHMKKEILRVGGRLDAIYCCTDLASEKDHCRKPGTFMAEQAKKDFPEIDFHKSIMVGDTKSDMEFGRNSGMVNVLVGDEPVPGPLVDLHVRDVQHLSQMMQQAQFL